MISKNKKRKYENKIETILETEKACTIELNNWEHEFLDSISKWLSEDKGLTMKQLKCLNKIYEKC
jgi:hypothetical protein